MFSVIPGVYNRCSTRNTRCQGIVEEVGIEVYLETQKEKDIVRYLEIELSQACHNVTLLSVSHLEDEVYS